MTPIFPTFANGVGAADGHGCGGDAVAHAAGAVGLVPFKTSRGAPSPAPFGFDRQRLAISLDPETSALRRVKRLKRSVWASGHLHPMADNGSRPPVCWFVTLTYVGVNDWNAGHISKALDGFRSWCRQRGIQPRYTWVAELQKRGAVHYHLLAWLPHGVTMPKWDVPWRTAKLGKERSPFWPHGMTNTQRAKAGVGYLMKYLSKLGELTQFPKGLRLYGVGGLTPQARQVRSWFNLPQWAKNVYGVGDLVRAGSKLVVAATGELLATPYRTLFQNGFLEVIQTAPIAPRWADGAFTTCDAVARLEEWKAMQCAA